MNNTRMAPMMAGYQDAHHSISAPPPSAPNASGPSNPSPYRYPDPPGHHLTPPSVSNHRQDGLPPVQPTNGSRQVHGAYTSSTGLGSMNAGLQPGPDIHSQQQLQRQQQQQQSPPPHHQQHQRQHSLGTLLQYNNGSAGNNGSTAHRGGTSPPVGHQPVTPASAASTSPVNKKNTRIPRACDLCSQRKVKCEGGTPPCRPCRELNVACTYDRAKKRRGPPNRAAEAAKEAEKRRRLDEEGHRDEGYPPAQDAAQVLVSLGAPNGSIVMDAEQCIAPFGVLQLLVDDFFTYIHPLTPFPHEPTFREAFHRREDRTNPEFLSLLASMIAALVASFPRSARLHLKTSHNYEKFPRSLMLVDRCMKVALSVRNADTMLKDVVTVNDACVSYFICLATGYTMRWIQCRRYLGESLRFLREMGFHRRRPPPTTLMLGPERPDNEPKDFITDEIGKRIYWCIFLGVRSMTQMGASTRDLILPPATHSSSYPDYPREVDDAYILADRILPQPEDTVSTITGLVKCAQAYRTMDDLVRIDLSHGIAAYPWEQQKQYLHNALMKVKEIPRTLPPELTIDMHQLSPNKLTFPRSSPDSNNAVYKYVPPAYPNIQPHHDVRHLFAADESKKRTVQYEIQKANIYASLVATRSYYVERYLSLRDIHFANTRAKAQADAAGNIVYRTAADVSSSTLAAAAVQAAADNDGIDSMFLDEREEVVQNLFSVLMALDQVNMEPNGASLISKIRQVACTLLADRVDRKGAYQLRNEEYLKGFLDILTRLEKTGGAGGQTPPGVIGQSSGTMTEQDEEDELRNWADLREQQQKMAGLSGFYAPS